MLQILHAACIAEVMRCSLVHASMPRVHLKRKGPWVKPHARKASPPLSSVVVDWKAAADYQVKHPACYA